MRQQQTISEAISFEGRGFRRGKKSKLRILPAPEDTGFRFRRVDLKKFVELEADFKCVSDVSMSTTLKKGNVKVHMVEHVLSALRGCKVDNAFLEIDKEEVPILDGSAKSYVASIKKVGFQRQGKVQRFLKVMKPVVVRKGESIIVALPFEAFRLSCTSKDRRCIHTHYADWTESAGNYSRDIAPARTFVVYDDVEPLLKSRKIRGWNLDMTVFLSKGKTISQDPMRFENEMARHKILDMIGDLALLGKPLKAHIVAVCPSHSLNLDLCKALVSENALE